MSKESLEEFILSTDISSADFSLDKVTASLDKFVLGLSITGENAELLKSMLVCLCSASNLKTELLKILKASKKNTDLSASLLVDIDTRYELLLAHCKWLLANSKIGSEFESKLKYGARLSEEFFPELIAKASKIQFTLNTELGAQSAELKGSRLSDLSKNLRTFNDYLSALLGRLPGRYDSLTTGLLGI